MKTIFTLIMTLITVFMYTQDTNNVLTNIDTTQHLMLKAGSCGSPDGPILESNGAPGSWQWLSDNGYCYSGINSTSDVTMCFTFTPSVSNILLNGGYSESCANNNFTAFNVYDNSCSFVTSSLNPTTLIAGQQYTWCVTMKAWGGGSCNGYTTFCPYWINNDPLPVELIYFSGVSMGTYNQLKWSTSSEINCDYYLIEKSVDFYDWFLVGTTLGFGTSSTSLTYTMNDYKIEGELYYYRLTQYDFNGESEIFKVIVIDNTKDFRDRELIKVVNTFGQEVNDDFKGIKIYLYSDGYVKKSSNQ